jgi:hypothetical protein
MQAAGWAEGSGEVREGPISFSDDELRSLEADMVPPEAAPEPEGGLVRAQIPDWLKEVAPPAAEEMEGAEGEVSPPAAAVSMTGLNEPMLPPGWAGPPSGTSEEEDDWLKPAAEEAPALPTWMEEQSPGATATIVTWLGDRGKGAAAERPPKAVPPTAVPSAPAAAEVAPSRAELPEWLAEQAPTEQASAAAAGSGAASAGWLSGVAEAAAKGSTITPEEVPWAGEPEGEPIQTGMYPEAEAEAAAQPGTLPDWLESIAGAESASGIRPRPETTPEWLAPEPARPQPAPATPKEPAGEAFGWLRELAEAEPPTPGAREAQPPEPTPPAWLTGERASDSSRTALGQPAGPEWLRGIAEPEPASGSDQEAASMDWLRDIAEPAPPEGTGAVSDQATMEPEPTGQDDSTDWVNLVSGGEGQTQPTSTGEWLKLLKEDGVPPPGPLPSRPRLPAVAAPSGQMGDDQVFDWLEALAAKQSVPAPETLPPSDVSPPTRPAAPHVARAVQPPEPPPAAVPASERAEVPVPEEADAGFDWLEEFVAAEEAEGTVAPAFGVPPAEPPTVDEILAPPTPMFEGLMAEEPTPTPEVPDWLKQLVAETPMAQPVPSEPVEEPEPLLSPSETWPALPAWMLAAGPSEEEPTVPPLPPVRGTAPVEPALEPIDELAESWVPPWETMGVEEPFPSAPAPPPAIDETIVRRPAAASVIAEAPEPEEAEPAPPKYVEPPTDVVEEVPDWLRTPAPYAAAAEVAPTEDAKPAEAEMEAEPDIPDWLTAPAAPPATDAPSAAPPVVAPPEPVAVVPPPPVVAPPEPVAAVPPPPPIAPPVPVAVVAETPTPEPVVAPAAEVHRAEAVPPPLPPAAPAPKPPLRAPKPKVVKPGLEEKLREARHALAVGDYRRAAHDYTAVIKKKYQLDEVTSELELALDRNPKASDLWQALGDAYMRGDRLQDAISAYERGVAVA